MFIDPPFGDNLNYSQLNLLWEGWLRVRTNVASEAIVDRATSRDLAFYQEKLRECLTEFRRVLKPGRWMTVVFHNSKNAVWNAIQTAILEAGFVIADVRTLDKKQGTPKQVNNLNAVKQDLVISAYKPTTAFETQFSLQAGTQDGIWSFVKEHLRQLPVFVSKASRAEAIAEREKHLLFDRMIAFHIQRGISMPISASSFYAGLPQRYPERDGMYFLPEQIAEYDRRRLDVEAVEQLELFVTDERSAIQWVRRQLDRKPTSFQELQPLYMKEAQLTWEARAARRAAGDSRRELYPGWPKHLAGRRPEHRGRPGTDSAPDAHQGVSAVPAAQRQAQAGPHGSAAGRFQGSLAVRSVRDHRGDGTPSPGSGDPGRPGAAALLRQCRDESW